jgi:hypothetical protein
LDAVALSSALQNESDIPAALTANQNARLPPTAKICFANRANGPDHVLQLAHERAPDGFENIDDIIGSMELEEVGRAYKQLAGFDMESVKQKGERNGRSMEFKIKRGWGPKIRMANLKLGNLLRNKGIPWSLAK